MNLNFRWKHVIINGAALRIPETPGDEIRIQFRRAEEDVLLTVGVRIQKFSIRLRTHLNSLQQTRHNPKKARSDRSGIDQPVQSKYGGVLAAGQEA